MSIEGKMRLERWDPDHEEREEGTGLGMMLWLEMSMQEGILPDTFGKSASFGFGLEWEMGREEVILCSLWMLQ